MYKQQVKKQKTALMMAATLAGSLVMPVIASAAEVDVKITNLTQGMYFTPILLAGHDANHHVFETGTTATSALQAMAEGGDIAALITDAEAMGSEIISNPAGGVLGPAMSVMVDSFDTQANGYLSIAAMILPSNDGFVGLDSWKIPQQAGTYTLYLNAYDAGTEANDELVVDGSGAAGILGIPANPGANGGTAGTGVTSTELTQKIHIHRGNVGDTNAMGGASDLDSRIHRWINPVAKVVVTVTGDL